MLHCNDACFDAGAFQKTGEAVGSLLASLFFIVVEANADAPARLIPKLSHLDGGEMCAECASSIVKTSLPKHS